MLCVLIVNFTPLSATSFIQYSLIGVETFEAYILGGRGGGG